MGSRMNRTVSAAQVQDLARSILQEQLRFVDSGPKCTVGNLFLVLFFAAARAASIFDACRRLGKTPCDQAVRNALSAWSPKMEELERRLNLALQARLPKGLFRKNRPMAIDQTQVPYYGQPFKDKRELCRGKPKA